MGGGGEVWSSTEYPLCVWEGQIEVFLKSHSQSPLTGVLRHEKHQILLEIEATAGKDEGPRPSLSSFNTWVLTSTLNGQERALSTRM